VKADHDQDLTPDQGDSGAPSPLPTREAVTAHRIALSKAFEGKTRHWGGVPTYLPREAAPLPMETSPYHTGRMGAHEPLLPALHQADRILVLGGPGAGKTVAMERLAWELCGASESVVPVLLEIFRYDGGPLAPWVRDALQATGHLTIPDDATLHAFLQDKHVRVFILADGIDEVDPAHRNALIEALAQWIDAYPRHPVIVTSCPQDPGWRRLRGAMDRILVLQPLSNEQVRTTLAAHLGRPGVALHNALDARQRRMSRTPLTLRLIEEAGSAGESIPETLGALYDRFVSRRFQADTAHRADVEIPERLKRRALTDLACAMGERRRCTRDEAIRAASRQLGGDTALADAILAACTRQGLLTGEDEVRFALHAMVQAHFAALALQAKATEEWALNGWARLKRKARWLLMGERAGLVALAVNEAWREPFLQLAGLLDDPDRLVRDVMRVNPRLAWQCAEEGRGITEETRQAMTSRAVGFLKSDRVIDRRRAISTLTHTRDGQRTEALFQAAADFDSEVAGLAVQALVAMGEDVRTKALALARQPDDPLHRAGVAYLTELLGTAVVWVPPGPFLMGSDREEDPQAYSDELPKHPVTLPGYWIGRYPVTVAQFRIFLMETGRAGVGHRLSGPDTHPMRLVSWLEARAYCRWLSERTGWAVTLPSEAEWEKAARGPSGRIYPWGNTPPNAALCNAGHRYGGTTPAGAYSPQGDSPYGCADMAGNVWEWTRSLYRDYPYDPDDGREDPEAGGGWVLRGGAFSTLRAYVRCAYRFGFDPNYRYLDYGGFRIVVKPSG
jgi:formylglycine-generating enzyme required for sulfatase activity